MLCPRLLPVDTENIMNADDRHAKSSGRGAYRETAEYEAKLVRPSSPGEVGIPRDGLVPACYSLYGPCCPG